MHPPHHRDNVFPEKLLRYIFKRIHYTCMTASRQHYQSTTCADHHRHILRHIVIHHSVGSDQRSARWIIFFRISPWNGPRKVNTRAYFLWPIDYDKTPARGYISRRISFQHPDIKRRPDIKAGSDIKHRRRYPIRELLTDRTKASRMIVMIMAKHHLPDT